MPTRLRLSAFAAAVALAVVFFHQGPSGNGLSRLMTVFSLVEEHTFVGDDFAELTWDKALVGRHYYSDKAPLSSYLVLPGYWLYRHGSAGKQTRADIEAANHIAIAVAAAVPFGLFAALLWWRVARERPGRDAVWLALLAAFGTFGVNYGNSYFGHVLGGLFLLASYVLAVDLGERFCLAGLFAGCAVATEYPLLIAVGFILGFLWRDRARRRQIGWFLVGAVPPALLFFAHNEIITGHYLQVPYSHVVDTWKPMQTAFGLRLPHPRAFWALLLLPHRGLLFYAPLLWLLVPLLWVQGRRFTLWLLGAMLAFNCTYFVWEGGWCTGPRHLTAATMLVLYEGVAAFARQPRWRGWYLGLGAAGVAVNLAFAATNPLPSAHEHFPLFRLVIPDLVAGRMNPHNLPAEWLHLSPPGHRWLLLAWVALLALIGVVFSRLSGDGRRV